MLAASQLWHCDSHHDSYTGIPFSYLLFEAVAGHYIASEGSSDHPKICYINTACRDSPLIGMWLPQLQMRVGRWRKWTGRWHHVPDPCLTLFPSSFHSLRKKRKGGMVCFHTTESTEEHKPFIWSRTIRKKITAFWLSLVLNQNRSAKEKSGTPRILSLNPILKIGLNYTTSFSFALGLFWRNTCWWKR